MDHLESVVADLNALNEQGKYVDALTSIERLLQQEQGESVLFVVQGNALYGLGRLEEALTAYARAIEADTFDVQARCNYGATLYALGRYVDALNACDAAILTDAQFAPAYMNAAHCLMALHHEEDAVYALRQAFSLLPKDASLGRTVADMAADLGDYEVARDTYFAVAELPDAAADIMQAIYTFFVQALEIGVEREDVLRDVKLWRQKFGQNPDVITLSDKLLHG